MALMADELARVTSGNVVNGQGEKIGGVGEIYLDDATGEPNWVTAKTGLFGTSESFIPLTGASVSGSDLMVDYDKETIKNAPRVDPDGHLTPDEEEALYSYYGLGGTSNGHDRDADHVATDSTTDTTDETGTVGHDTSGPTTDDAMTLSEEQVRVGTRTQESGRVRLRKYVVTENVTQTVPVSREEVRIEREPITDANRGDATSGPAISEEEHEVVLHEESPVVEKEAVPVERVRLDTETVTDQVTVNEEVRKEQLDTDIDETPGAPSSRS
ncbi:MAG TPA: PRC and DUF2382 domain-containing protein [Microlunatus sp.]